MKLEHYVVDLSCLSPSERLKYSDTLTKTAQTASLIMGNGKFQYDVIWNSDIADINEFLKLPDQCTITKSF